jgi:hypothetical protein
VVEALCPLSAIIDGGKLKGFGPLDELKRPEQGVEALFLELLEAHLRTAFNAGLRNAGLAVTALALTVSSLLLLGLLVPLCGAAAIAGAKLATEPRVFAPVCGAVFAFFPLLGGVTSLMTGDGQELDLDKLEPYPVPPAALFAAELFASFVNPVMALAAGLQTSFALGALVGGGARAWPVLVALATGLLLQGGARAQTARGAVAARAARREPELIGDAACVVRGAPLRLRSCPPKRRPTGSSSPCCRPASRSSRGSRWRCTAWPSSSTRRTTRPASSTTSSRTGR